MREEVKVIETIIAYFDGKISLHFAKKTLRELDIEPTKIADLLAAASEWSERQAHRLSELECALGLDLPGYGD